MNQQIKSDQQNELDLGQIFSIIWSKKKAFFSIIILVTTLTVLLSLNLPNIYNSSSLLAPTQPQDSVSSRIGGLSSLSAIGGFSLPETPVSKSKEGIERIKSFEFFDSYFLPNIKLEDLMAVEEWVAIENKIIYDEDLYNSTKKEWIRKVSYPRTKKPSAQEAYKVYKRILSINQDDKTQFLNISIEHKSPFIAKEWLDIIIYQINESMRKVDADQAERSIAYLNESMKSTNIQSLKEAISQLLEDQIQVLMLTSSSKYYIFKVIDAPVVKEEKSKPNRFLILIFGILFGAAISFIFVFLDYFRRS